MKPIYARSAAAAKKRASRRRDLAVSSSSLSAPSSSAWEPISSSPLVVARPFPFLSGGRLPPDVDVLAFRRLVLRWSTFSLASSDGTSSPSRATSNAPYQSDKFTSFPASASRACALHISKSSTDGRSVDSLKRCCGSLLAGSASDT